MRVNLKGVKKKTKWATFSPDGYIQFRSISDTKKDAKERTMRSYSDESWDDYAAAGFTVEKVIVDISFENKGNL
jgi:hypothetical protein